MLQCLKYFYRASFVLLINDITAGFLSSFGQDCRLIKLQVKDICIVLIFNEVKTVLTLSKVYNPVSEILKTSQFHSLPALFEISL